jgi:hypothetical protein
LSQLTYTRTQKRARVGMAQRRKEDAGVAERR